MKGKLGLDAELLGKNKCFSRKEVVVPWEFSTGERGKVRDREAERQSDRDRDRYIATDSKRE